MNIPFKVSFERQITAVTVSELFCPLTYSPLMSRLFVYFRERERKGERER